MHTGTSDCKVFRSSDVVENYLSTEEERGQAVDRRFYQFMCGKKHLSIRMEGHSNYAPLY